MTPHDIETVEIETRYGVIGIFPHDDPIGLSISRYGEWAQHEIDALTTFFGPGDVVIDVGANIGTHSLAFARKVGPEGKVIAFEPQPTVAGLLQRTMMNNGISWVDARQAGVGEKPGELMLPAIDYSAHINVGAVALDQNGSADGLKVPIESLDDLGLSRCAFVKIDAEGMGHLVLDGMQTLIAACRPTVAFEINSIEESVLLFQRWAQEGYEKYLLRTPVFNNRNFRSESNNLFGLAAETMLVFVPAEKTALVKSIQLPKQMTAVNSYEAIASEILLTPRFGDEIRFDGTVGYKLIFEKLKDTLGTYQNEVQKYYQSNVLALQQLNYQIARSAQVPVERASLQSSQSENAPLISSQDEKGAVELKNPVAQLVEITPTEVQGEQDPPNSTLQQQSEIKGEDFRAEPAVASLASKIFKEKYAKIYLISDSDLFDEVFYVQQIQNGPKSRLGAVKHYLKHGVKLGLDPSSAFSTLGYIRLNPDVKQASLNPLVHYMTWGRKEGRPYCYSEDYKILDRLGLADLAATKRLSSLDIDLIDASPLLDECFYQSQLAQPLGNRRAIALHYAYAGWGQGLDPSERFSTTGYQILNPGAVAPDDNPFLHYVKTGIGENRPLLNSLDFRLVKELSLVESLSSSLGSHVVTSTVFDLIDNSSWFDDSYYGKQVGFPEGNRRRCVVHYVLDGWRDGLDPSAGFSTNGFLRLYQGIGHRNICPLTYFLFLDEGARPPVINVDDYEAIKSFDVVDERLIRETGDLLCASEFDPAYYIREAGLRCSNERHAAAHYLLVGWKKLIDPSPLFSTIDYLETHLGLAAAGDINPLLHYVLYGKAEGEVAATVEERKDKLASRYREVAPDQAKWDALSLRGGIVAENPVCDVIVPVYRGYAETMACLYSVLSNEQKIPFRLLVVNDCSPEPDLATALRDFALRGLIELIDLPENRGFVGAVNEGMAANPDRDVVLLNSDAEVFGDWLDRMYVISRSDTNIATITPFSNNATICSYPFLAEDYDQPFEVCDAEIDALAAEVNAGYVVDIPTGVGFCMFIRRETLREIGPFDEERFGRGYGEENDFCRRAILKGWRNVLAPNIFARHYGSVSFGFEKYAQIRKSQAILAELYPTYEGEVAEFCLSDPTLKFRRNLDVARLKKHSKDEAMLFVSHRWGGGTERHIRDLAHALEEADIPVFTCREIADPKGSMKTKEIRIGRLGSAPFPNMPVYCVDGDVDAFVSDLTDLGIRYIHIHQLVGMSPYAAEFFIKVTEKFRVRTFVTLHDYYSVCPRINFVDETKTYCGEPDIKVCEACVKDMMRVGGFSVHEWRKRFKKLLLSAEKVFVPNDDVANRMLRYFPEISLSVKPHAVFIDKTIQRKMAGRHEGSKAVRHVVIPGLISAAKGSRVLLDAAIYAERHNLPLKFTVLGYTDIDESFTDLTNVTITGAYEEHQAIDLILKLDADILWFPSLWPETFSYTLSFAFQTGIYPVAFDIGAPANRLKKAGWGAVWPLETIFSPEKVCGQFMSAEIEAIPESALAYEAQVQAYDKPLSQYYEVGL